MIRYGCSVVPVSRDSAALLKVSAAPAMTRGIRGPRLATIRPAIGAHSAITTGIGKMVSPACSGGQAAYVLQVQGGQEQEPGHRGDRADRGEVGARERHAAEEPEVDHGLRAARLIGEQHGQRGHGQGEEAEDLR